MDHWDNTNWEMIKQTIELEKNKQIEVTSEQEYKQLIYKNLKFFGYNFDEIAEYYRNKLISKYLFHDAANGGRSKEWDQESDNFWNVFYKIKNACKDYVDKKYLQPIPKIRNIKDNWYGGIYMIINIKNNMRYIGSTDCFSSRFDSHKYDLRHNKHHCNNLQLAWNEYGENNFKFVKLELINNNDSYQELSLYGRDYLRLRESIWIDKYKSLTYNPQRSLDSFTMERYYHQQEIKRLKNQIKKLKKDVYGNTKNNLKNFIA